MRKLKSLVVLLLTVALTLTGCSSSEDTSSTGSQASAGGSERTVLNVQTDTDLSTMDHQIATDGTSFVAQSLVFSGLMELDSNNSPVNELAKSYEVSDDGLTYTFHLDEAYWSNGTQVTANDFVFSWNRLTDPETGSEYSFIVSTANIESYEAVDDLTFVVHLSLPCDFFLSLMAFPSFFPLNEEFYKSQGDQYALTPENMIYCGPYVMTSWISGNSYSFEKNENYFRADEFTDTVDEINFKFVQDTQSAILEFESGNLDYVILTGEMVDAYESDDEYYSYLAAYLWYLSINHTVDQYQNANLRKALALAVDRETIASSVLKDGSIAAAGIIPTSFTTGPDGKDYRATTPAVTSFDADKAAEYYAKAKEELGGDVSIELLFEDTEASKNVAEYIQYCWETYLPGVTVTLNSKPKKTRLSLMNEQSYEVALTRWGPDYADPQTYMDLFVSTNLDNNAGRYASEAYDELVLEATTGAAATDSEERWSLFKKAEKVLVEEDNGVIPVYQNGGARLISSSVKSGIDFHSAGVDSFRHVVKE